MNPVPVDRNLIVSNLQLMQRGSNLMVYREALKDAEKMIVNTTILPPPWVSVKDDQPKVGIDLLVCTQSKNGTRNIDKGWWDGDRFIHRGGG